MSHVGVGLENGAALENPKAGETKGWLCGFGGASA
jgi:hypothetical protein